MAWRFGRPRRTPTLDAQARPLRILALNWRCHRHPDMGGSEVNLFRQATRWVREGHDVTVLCARDARGSRLPEREILDGVAIQRVGGRFTVYAHAALFLLRHGGEFDCVLDVSNGIPFFTPLFTRVPGALLIHHFHGRQWFAELPFVPAALGLALERFVVPLVYRRWPVIAVSPTTRDAVVARGFRPSQVSVVYNGVEQPRTASTSTGDGARTIVYFGRLKRYKRLERLIRAFAKLRPEFPDARLILAGDGDARGTISALASDLGLGSVVDLPGFVDEDTKAAILSSARVFVTPSMHEGWGLSVIEANSYGCPAVAYNVPGLSAAIRANETGFLASDDDEFRDLIARLLRDDGLRARLSSAARSWALQFDWDTCARETLKVLQLAVHGAPRSTALAEPSPARLPASRTR
jgi:glycosyltransferase involved in cell wall biosynthesis